MQKSEIYAILNSFAPPELAEEWDCPGIAVENNKTEIKKVMLALTVTDDIVSQAKMKNCDMIISHHPLFFIPFEYKNINIFSAHTNLDLTEGGTTDELIKELGFTKNSQNSFVRYVKLQNSLSIEEFTKKLADISPNLRFVNNKNIEKIQKIGFCAGSGADFIETAEQDGADAFVTGDLKFHTALESKIVLFDIGHFESEILVLKVLEKLLKNKVDIVFAEEKSPFIQFKKITKILTKKFQQIE